MGRMHAPGKGICMFTLELVFSFFASSLIDMNSVLRPALPPNTPLMA